MTNEYRATELAAAVKQGEIFRAAFIAAKTRKARLYADESLNFWSNKVAFLEQAR